MTGLPRQAKLDRWHSRSGIVLALASVATLTAALALAATLDCEGEDAGWTAFFILWFATGPISAGAFRAFWLHRLGLRGRRRSQFLAGMVSGGFGIGVLVVVSAVVFGVAAGRCGDL